MSMRNNKENEDEEMIFILIIKYKTYLDLPVWASTITRTSLILPYLVSAFLSSSSLVLSLKFADDD